MLQTVLDRFSNGCKFPQPLYAKPENKPHGSCKKYSMVPQGNYKSWYQVYFTSQAGSTWIVLCRSCSRCARSSLILCLCFNNEWWTNYFGMSKQKSVAASSTESEYMALCLAAKECVWILQLLDQMNLPLPKPVTIFKDNHGCIAIAKNPAFHDHTKHISLMYQRYLLSYCNIKEL